MKENIINKLKNLNSDYYELIENIGKVAHEVKQKAYLVGGIVRDILLDFKNLDIDIVVEDNALTLAKALEDKFKNCKVSKEHDRFQTAKIVFNIKGKEISIDLASTREEIYEFPAALPNVRVSTLEKDLIRRDFTINALAVSLMPDDFGEVVDLFNGLSDLKEQKIRILHDLSFVDDPTRMIRAVRFAARFGFEIEKHTLDLLKRTIDSRQFDNLIEKIRGDRVKIEIKYLFNLSNIEQALDSFFATGISKMISTRLKYDDEVKEIISRAKYFIGKTKLNSHWLIYLALLAQDLENKDKEKILKNLQLTGDEIKIINKGFSTYSNLVRLLAEEVKINSTHLYKELKNIPVESILFVKALFIKNPEIVQLLDEYLEKTSMIKLEITGDDLIALGIKEGRRVGEVLEKVLEKKIQNPEMTKKDELSEAEKL